MIAVRLFGVALVALGAIGCVAGPGASTAPPATEPGVTASPSAAPSSTQATPGASPLPPGLQNRVWYTQLDSDAEGRVRFVAGTLDGTSMIALPPGSVPIVAGIDVLVVVEHEGRGSSATSTLRSVSLADGATRNLTTIPGSVETGVLLGNIVVVTGTSAEAGFAPAVLGVDLASGAVRAVIDSSRLPENPTATGVSRILTLSPSRKTMAVDLCQPGADRCTATILGTGDWSVARSFDHPGFVRAVTDEVLIAGNDNWPGRIAGLGLADGRSRWSIEATTFSRGYATTSGAYVVTRFSGPDSPVELLLIDASSGEARVVASWSATKNLGLVPELSIDDTAVLATDPAGLIYPDSDGTIALATVDLRSGALTEPALTFAVER